MEVVLLQMAALMAFGSGWRWVRPLGLEAEPTRRVLTGLVYVLLLPALVLEVLWRAPLGRDAALTALVAAVGVLTALVGARRLYRALGTAPTAAGALILAAAFPNVTYLGLPVLERTLGPWARGIAIQYDLFACTPLLLTVGVLLARTYGESDGEPPWKALLKVPPLWAALLAVGLNVAEVPMPDGLHGLLTLLANGVVPLMLLSLGMSLTWGAISAGRVPLVLPVLLIQLVLVPLLVWGVGSTLGLSGDRLVGVVLEGAMPCMVLGVVICDRFRLDTGLYAAAVALSTLCSLVTLPLWYRILT